MNIYGSLMDIYDEKNTDIQDEKKHKHSRRQENKNFIPSPSFPRQTAQFDR